MKKIIIAVLMLMSVNAYAQDVINPVVNKDTIVFCKPTVKKTMEVKSTGKYVTLVAKRGPEEVFTNGKSYWVNRVSKEGKEYKCYLTKEQKAMFVGTYK